MVENHYVKLVGLKENNLKNITLTIPKKKITVFTGVSGSGNLLLYSTQYVRKLSVS